MDRQISFMCNWKVNWAEGLSDYIILEQNGLVTIGTKWVSDHWNRMSQWPLEQNKSVTIGTEWVSQWPLEQNEWVSDHWNRMSHWVTIGTEWVSDHWNRMSHWVTIGTEWVSDHWNRMSESVTIGTEWVSQWPLEQNESVTIGTEGVSHHGTILLLTKECSFNWRKFVAYISITLISYCVSSIVNGLDRQTATMTNSKAEEQVP